MWMEVAANQRPDVCYPAEIAFLCFTGRAGPPPDAPACRMVSQNPLPVSSLVMAPAVLLCLGSFYLTQEIKGEKALPRAYDSHGASSSAGGLPLGSELRWLGSTPTGSMSR